MGSMLSTFSESQGDDSRQHYKSRRGRHHKRHRIRFEDEDSCLSFEEDSQDEEDDQEFLERRFEGSHRKQHHMRVKYRNGGSPYQYSPASQTSRKHTGSYVPRMSNGSTNIYPKQGSQVKLSAGKRFVSRHHQSTPAESIEHGLTPQIQKRKTVADTGSPSNTFSSPRKRQDILHKINHIVQTNPQPKGGKGNGAIWLTPLVRSKIEELDIFHDKELDEALKKMLVLDCCEISLRAVMRHIIDCFYSEEELVELDKSSICKQPEIVELLNVIYATRAEGWDPKAWNVASTTLRECFTRCAVAAKESLKQKNKGCR